MNRSNVVVSDTKYNKRKSMKTEKYNQNLYNPGRSEKREREFFVIKRVCLINRRWAG